MGAVYEAIDQRLNRTVALKETLVETDELRRAFEREAHLLANLRHPTLPKVIDHFVEGDGQFIVMEFIGGDDLGAVLEKRGQPFSWSEVSRWADELLGALEYLHTHRPPVLHRDIKPSNLKLTAQGQIVLLDFGLAKGAAGQMETLTASRSILGYTPNYAPLEQVQGTGTDPRSDLYSLAATIYHLMTSVRPPGSLARAAAALNGQSDPLRPPHEINPQMPRSASAVLMQSMALNIEQRPHTAAMMRERLRSGDAVAPAPVTVPQAGGDMMTTKADLLTKPSVESVRHTERGDQRAPSPAGKAIRVMIPDQNVRAESADERQRGMNYKWPLVTGLGIALVAAFIALASLLMTRDGRQSGRRIVTDTNSNRAQVSISPSPTIESVTNAPSPDANPFVSGAVEAAREKLRLRNIPYTEEAFIRTVENGDVDAVNLFITAGISTGAKDARGRTALMIAAAKGRDHLARILLNRGADVNARDATNSTALMDAATGAHHDTLRVLLDSGAEVDAENEYGQTALIVAAQRGHTDGVRLLINRNADVNAHDRDDRSALRWAEINGHAEVARLLRVAGATRE